MSTAQINKLPDISGGVAGSITADKQLSDRQRDGALQRRENSAMIFGAFDQEDLHESMMMAAPMPENEAARLEALRRYISKGIEHEELFDNFTRISADLCSTPSALLSIVEADRIRYRANTGSNWIEGSRENSFCSWAILTPDIFVVSDALKDIRFWDNPLVRGEPGVRFYAGAPLLTSTGHALGVLCVLDKEPRELTDSQALTLQTLARAIVTQLELSCKSLELEKAITERQQAFTYLAASEERYALVIRSANDGLWDWNLENNEMHFCLRWKAILGYEEADIGTSPDEWLSRVHPEDIEEVQSSITAHLVGSTSHFQSEHRLRHKDNSYRWVLTRGLAAWDADKSIYRMAGSLTDITDQKEAESRLLHNASHDALTGLPNRTVFMDRLRRSLERAKHHEDYLFALLFLDLDRFKIINDSLGHHIGDQLLIAIARRLEASLRPGDMAARFGGDEFAIILDHIKKVGDTAEAAERIQKQFEEPFNLGGHEIFASVSIGITHSQVPYEEPEDFLRNADSAMYRAKDQGRGRFEVFDRDMHTRAVEMLQLETDLRRALARDEFRVHYQPIVSLENWRITGFEALLRWEHPSIGSISPSEFVPVAEETGLIIPIGQWVLKEACQQLRIWQEQFPSDPPLTMSVNLSGKQFSQPDLIDQIKQALAETGLDAASLKVEITESAIIENIESATMALNQLKALGIRILLDDFGTGYSSLSYLHRFPIDTLKIDRSFVTRMSLPKNSEIIRTIISLAINLGMDVIAEGVETREQVIQLTGLNCEYVQGYLLSRPIDGKAMKQLIEQTYQQGLSQPDTEATEPANRIEVPAIPESPRQNAKATPDQEGPTIKHIPVAGEVYSEFYSDTINKNRRRCKRVRLSIPTRVTGYVENGDKWGEMTKTLDVSRTGVTITLTKKLKRGAVLYLLLPLPEKLRKHGLTDPSYGVYALVRRATLSKDGRWVVGLEFLGEHPPEGYLDKPWTVFKSNNASGAEAH